MDIDKKSYQKNGFCICKDFFTKEEVKTVFDDVRSTFVNQMIRLGIVTTHTLDEKEFEEGMYSFFDMDSEAFFNTGKQVQHLISLHRISLSTKVETALKGLGLKRPNISTRPVLFFNHPRLAKKEVYHTVFAHQDWRSMQGSLDAVVMWFPLIDINQDLGALEIIPGSHIWGLRSPEMDQGFGRVELSEEEKSQLVPVEMKMGDALFFSSFLIHQSGKNVTDNIRWSAHYRYNNLDESSFINRKYAHPYIYRPQEELITQGFPKKEELEKIYSQ